MTRQSLPIAALVALISLPANAQDSFGEPVTAEILSGWTLPDGRRMAGLRLTLAEGWKTYWRVPGDAGIPPHFDWGEAQNVRDVDVSWPTPDVFYDYGLRSLGYEQSVTLPLAIQPDTQGGDIRLRGTMRLGICSDICVPYQIDLDTVLAPPETRPTPVIAAALAQMPFSASEGDVRSATCQIRPTDDGMQIETRVELPHTGGEEVAVIEPGISEVWTSEPKTSRQGDTLIATADMIHIEGTAFSIDRSQVRITVIGSQFAVDIQGCTGS